MAILMLSHPYSSCQTDEVESQKHRGEEMDVMLAERDRKLAEKEAYIIHLQTALAGDTSTSPPQVGHYRSTAWVGDIRLCVTPLFLRSSPKAATAEMETGASQQELQTLVQQLNRKVEEWEERCALLQEQAESLKILLHSEQEQYSQKESMYEKNVGDITTYHRPSLIHSILSQTSRSLFQIQTFKDIILQKEEQLSQVNQQHEQELFKLAAKSDASADLEQVILPSSAAPLKAHLKKINCIFKYSSSRKRDSWCSVIEVKKKTELEISQLLNLQDLFKFVN